MCMLLRNTLPFSAVHQRSQRYDRLVTYSILTLALLCSCMQILILIHVCVRIDAGCTRSLFPYHSIPFRAIPYHSIPCNECCAVLRLLDHGRPWVAAQLGPHTWRRRTKQGQVWRSRRAAVMLRRKMPEPFVQSISRKRLTQRRLLIVCMTYAMEVMNLSPKVRQHSFRNPAPCKTAPRTNSLR